MIKKTLYAWKPQEPASDFDERVLARLLANPPLHLRVGAVGVRVKPARPKRVSWVLVIALVVFLVPMLAFAGSLLWSLITTSLPFAPFGATPGAAPTVAVSARLGEAAVDASSVTPHEPPGKAPETMGSRAQPAPLTARGAASTGTSTFTGTPRASGSSAGGAEPQRPKLRPFDENAAHAALDRELQNAKAKCPAPPGVDAQSGILTATFQPNGMLEGSNVVKSNLNRNVDSRVEHSVDKQTVCIGNMVSLMMNMSTSVAPFDGPAVTITHPFKF